MTKWTYVPTTVQGQDDGTWKNVNVRLTLQASPRNKFNFFWDEQRLCTQCLSGSNSRTTAPEAHYNNHAPPRVQQVDLVVARGRTGCCSRPGSART